MQVSRPLRILDLSVLREDPKLLRQPGVAGDYYLPQAVLARLNDIHGLLPEQARNLRQANQWLAELLARAGNGALNTGILLHQGQPEGARLYFEVSSPTPEDLPSAMLTAVMTVQRKYPDRAVILLSNDLHLRVRAQVLGLATEAHDVDAVVDDPDLLDPGWHELTAAEVKRWFASPANSYQLSYAGTAHWLPQQGLFHGDTLALRVMGQAATTSGLRTVLPQRDYQHQASVWGLNARNREQNLALNLLLDPEVDLVTLLGAAGTGKTLLALAAGLAQTVEEKRYQSIIMTRATIALGEDIGYLPGSEEEKMTPWMGALLDNMEVLAQSATGSSRWQQAVTEELLRQRVQIRSLNFMRGRTFLQRFLILDEAQNLSPSQMKTLISRAGPGSKVVCLGNLSQIDAPSLTATTSGLARVVERSKHWPHSGHVLLRQGERSRLADFASEQL